VITDHSAIALAPGNGLTVRIDSYPAAKYLNHEDLFDPHEVRMQPAEIQCREGKIFIEVALGQRYSVRLILC
jgi:hypothetical protein